MSMFKLLIWVAIVVPLVFCACMLSTPMAGLYLWAGERDTIEEMHDRVGDRLVQALKAFIGDST